MKYYSETKIVHVIFITITSALWRENIPLLLFFILIHNGKDISAKRSLFIVFAVSPRI